MAVFNLLLNCENTRLSYPMNTSYLCNKLSLNNFKSGSCLTYFEELKHGLPRYRNKHQQTTKQTKSHCSIQQESNVMTGDRHDERAAMNFSMIIFAQTPS